MIMMIMIVVLMMGEVTFSMKAIDDDFYNAKRRLGIILRVFFTCLSSSQVYFLQYNHQR